MLAEAASSTPLGLDHLTDRAHHVCQTFLLFHTGQSLSIVAPAPIRHHHSSILRRYHLSHLFVAVTSTHLVHRGFIGLERHQEGALTAHSPSRVVGVNDPTRTHRIPQPLVRIPHRTSGASQCVLGDRTLAQLQTGQRSEHRRHPPHRNTHSIVEHVRRSHHSSTHSVRTRPVLVRTNLGVASSYPSAAATTPTHLHPVFSHLRSGHRRDVGHLGNIHSLLLEHSSTSGTVVVGHRHIHWRPRQLICRGRLPVAEVPHARLSTRTSGLVDPSTLGERCRLTLAGPLGGGELPAQLLDRRGQTRVVTL